MNDPEREDEAGQPVRWSAWLGGGRSMHCHPSFLKDAILSRCEPARQYATRLRKSFKQEYGSLSGYFERVSYRFWKRKIPRRIQRVYDLTCLYGQLFPYYLAVLVEEVVILFTEGFDVFVFVHNSTWNRWKRDSRRLTVE